MKTNRLKFQMLAAALSVAMLFHLPAAEEPLSVATQISLAELLSEVLANNSELKFYEAEIAAAKAGRKTAGALANPEISGDIGQKKISGSGVSGEGIAWSVSVLQPIEWPGRLGLRKAIANREVQLAELGFERFKLALTGRVRVLAYVLFAAQEKAAAVGEVAERFQTLREVLVQRDPAGLTPMLETRIIEATELTMQRRASDATLAAQAALLELNQLRGVAPATRVTVIPGEISLPPLSLPAKQSVIESQEGTFATSPSVASADKLQTLLALARTNNFELRVRTAELSQQGFRVDLARNEKYPALSIGPAIAEENVAGTREQIIGLAVSLPLPLWNRNGGNIATARARQAQAEVSLAVAQRDVERRVVEAALTYETKLGEMSRWRPDAVQHFKEAAELADRHYRLGAVPVSTYVELQKQYLEAVESLLETKQAALEASAQLELLTGPSLPLVKAEIK